METIDCIFDEIEEARRKTHDRIHWTVCHSDSDALWPLSEISPNQDASTMAASESTKMTLMNFILNKAHEAFKSYKRSPSFLNIFSRRVIK